MSVLLGRLARANALAFPSLDNNIVNDTPLSLDGKIYIFIAFCLLF